jgi:hypothetical protein
MIRFFSGRSFSSGNVTDEVWKKYIDDQKLQPPDDNFRREIKVSKKEMQALSLTPHDFHGEWNYKVAPNHAHHK